MRTLHYHKSISVKHILFLWLVLCLVPGIVQAGNQCDNSLTVPLLIDQKIQVGVVKVNYDDHRLNIKYVANDGWLIEKTHLAVSNSFEGLPQDRYGNPKLRRFPHKSTHQAPVAVVNHMLSSQQWPLGTELYIAAHAAVVSTKRDDDSKYSKHGKKRYSAKSWYGRGDAFDNDDRDHKSSYKTFRETKRSLISSHFQTGYSNKGRYNDYRLKKAGFASYDDKNDHEDYGHGRSKYKDYGHNKHEDNDHKHRKYYGDGHSDRKYKRCERKHEKRRSSYNRSAWGKGETFPGEKDGFYFTFTLKSCKPPVASTVQFSDPLFTSSEDEQNAVVTVTRTGDLNDEATVIIRTADGTAEAGIDYGAVDMQLLFAPGETAIDVMVPVIDDSDVEDLETINVQLFDAQGATLGEQDTSIIELTDNDVPAPQGDIFFFDPADYIFRENSGLVSITVRRDGNLIGEASVDYLVVGGTAQPGVDYIFMPGTLVFAEGQSTATIELTIVEDRAVDPNETILVGIENPVNGQIIQPSTAAVITIEDNEGNN